MNQTAMSPDITLMQMLTGYWACQTLATAARLGVIDALPGKADELATKLALDSDGLTRLLRGCVALEAMNLRQDGTFELTEMGQMLRTDAPRSMAAMAIMMTDPGHWNSWGQLPHSVRTGETGVFKGVQNPEIFDYYAQNPEESHNFNRAMAGMTGAWAAQLGESYDFTPFATIADIGGNHGLMLQAALRQNPKARGLLFDLANVLSDVGTHERVEKVVGNFFDSVPVADCYILKHILHDWNDEQSVAILKTIRQAMPEGGRLLILEMLLEDEPGMADMMNLNMLVMTGGRERTAEQFRVLLEQAGLKLNRVLATPAMYSIVEAVRN